MPTRRLVIDIGTNSVLALLAEITNNGLTVIFDEKKTTRLGQGMAGSGRLSLDSIERTAEAVDAFMKKDRYDSALLLGTEALRASSNANEFQACIYKQTGERVTVLSGEKEAELNYTGALYRLPLTGSKIAVIDVGGGSTEIAYGNSHNMICAISMPLGASRLYESVSVDSLEKYMAGAARIIMDTKGGFVFDDVDLLIGTGGTITSIATIDVGIKKYDPAAVHGYHLSVKRIREISSQFEGLDSAKRKGLIPSDPERAELILPGAGIFLSILGILRREKLTVSTGGLRFGAALRPDLIDK